MHIAIVTAGGAGMFCGSCMHDNTWARALMAAGHEVSLIPTYTPIRVDDHNESMNRVFLGGINVYLNDKLSWWSHLPRRITQWLDRPGIIQFATRKSVSNKAQDLGELTLSMLHGESGPQRQAFAELDSYISDQLRPDVVIFSNAMLVGAVRVLKERFPGPIFCVLQGDDVFLDQLPAEFRTPVIDEISRRSQDFDGFFVHSQFYLDYISAYLGLPAENFSVLPLGIDLHDHVGVPEIRQASPFTVGYFARIAPEKGLHNLVSGFVELRKQIPDAELKIGGYLGDHQRAYLEKSLDLAQAGRSSISYVGSPQTTADKVRFLNSLDVLSVPTDFLEPKGIYVLEALANGIPVVQPAHGAFPEILDATQGGILVEPKNPSALAIGLQQLADPNLRLKFAQQGKMNVGAHYNSEVMALKTTETLQRYLGS